MGIEIIDVQLKSINYNNQVQTKQFNRMVSEQNMIAEKYRAQGQGKKQEILVRVSPGIDPHTHAYTTTGIIDSKFGFSISLDYK